MPAIPNVNISLLSNSSSPCNIGLEPCSPDTSPNTTCLEPVGMEYDQEGALMFTVVVVLVYGMGIMGLLGVYSNKKRNAEDKIKEGGKFAKTFDEKKYLLEKQARKSAITKLVDSIHGTRYPGPGRVITNPLLLNLGIPGATEFRISAPRVAVGVPTNDIPETSDIQVTNEDPGKPVPETDSNHLPFQLSVIRESYNEDSVPRELESECTESMHNATNRPVNNVLASIPGNSGQRDVTTVNECSATNQDTQNIDYISSVPHRIIHKVLVSAPVKSDRRNAITGGSSAGTKQEMEDNQMAKTKR